VDCSLHIWHPIPPRPIGAGGPRRGRVGRISGWKIKEAPTKFLLWTSTTLPTQKTMDWLLTTRPSGAVGAEGAGTGLSVGGNRGRGAPDRAGPPPPMRGRLLPRGMGGGGAAVSPAAWPCGRARRRLACTAAPRCHADRGHRQHGSYFAIPPATSPWSTMDVHMPWTFSDCTGTWLGGMTTNQSAIRNWRSPPRPPADGATVWRGRAFPDRLNCRRFSRSVLCARTWRHTICVAGGSHTN
jgi:hypothetical protein